MELLEYAAATFGTSLVRSSAVLGAAGLSVSGDSEACLGALSTS